MKMVVLIFMGLIIFIGAHEYYCVLCDPEYPQLRMDAFKRLWIYQNKLNFKIYSVLLLVNALSAVGLVLKNKMRAAIALSVVAIILFFIPAFDNL